MSADQRQAGDQHLGVARVRSEASLAEAVAELERLDWAALRRRWRSRVGSTMPPDLGRALALRVLAYKLQAQHLSDLDKASTRELAAMRARRNDVAAHDSATLLPLFPALGGRPNAPSCPPPPKPRPLARPGTLVVREYGGVRHRVMVLDEGIAWNGKTYDSLSQVALAITGTRWNGPRFFGLRDKVDKEGGRPPVNRRDALTPPRRPRLGLTHMWNGPTGKMLFGGLIQLGAVQSYVRPSGAGV